MKKVLILSLLVVVIHMQPMHVTPFGGYIINNKINSSLQKRFVQENKLHSAQNMFVDNLSRRQLKKVVTNLCNDELRNILKEKYSVEEMKEILQVIKIRKIAFSITCVLSFSFCIYKFYERYYKILGIS